MFPTLLKIEAFSFLGSEWGPFNVHSYGILIATGFVLSTLIAIRLGKQDRIKPDDLLDLAFWLLLAGVIGAKLLYAVLNLGSYYNACFHPEIPNALNHNLPLNQPECWRLLQVWEGGMVWFGGLLGGLLAGYLFLKKRRLSFPVVADAALGAIPFGHFIGRLGCLSAGCCWGRVTSGPLGVTFPKDSLPYTTELGENMAHTLHSVVVPLHPTQLYEAAGELLIFFILLGVRYKRRFYGQVALTFLILYSALRFTVEFFRGDRNRGFLISWEHEQIIENLRISERIGISTSQVIALLVVIGAILWMRRLLAHNDAK